jgi:aspartyl/glutamyl-tRNA(Asn/Gln) amidotransferase C subunit
MFVEIDVSHLARLAGLRFTEKGMAEVAEYLRHALEAINRLPESHLEEVPPTFWVGDVEPIILDADSPRPGIRHEDVMAIAPARDGPYILVPREDEGKDTQEKKSD